MQLSRMALFVFATTTLLSGCTHLQLRHNTIGQSETVSEIYEQQVLDNLAMFVCNPQAVPHFATLSSGSSDVTDKADVGASPLNSFRTVVGISGGRTAKEGWNLNPISDAHKLLLMRCAYQRAVGCPDVNCPDCLKIEEDFEGQTPQCTIQCGFIQSSERKCDIPDDCCQSYGEYCGCYVWVKPNPCARRSFAQLVLKVLDYAIHDNHQGATKTVEVTIDGVKQSATVPLKATVQEIHDSLSGVAPENSSNPEMIRKIQEEGYHPRTRDVNQSIRDFDRTLQTLGVR